MYQFEGTYLKAIQKLPGITKGQKLKYINQTADLISETGSGWNQIPEPLQPLIKAVVGRKTNNFGYILDSIKSDDQLVVSFVLEKSNYFSLVDSPFSNFSRLDTELLSLLSVISRTKVLKLICLNLRETEKAEEFFSGIAINYNLNEATPFLMHCSEEFIYEHLTKQNKACSNSLLMKLYKKHPAVVIRYLMLSKIETEKYNRDDHHVKVKRNFSSYLGIIKCFLNDNFSEFIDLCKHHRLTMNLGANKSRIFLKQGKSFLLEDPHIFFPILDKKVVTKSLNLKQMRDIVFALLPQEMKQFNSDSILDYFNYLDDIAKLSVVKRIFRDAYDSNLEDNPGLVSKRLLLLFPAEERFKIAEINCKDDPSWGKINYSSSYQEKGIFGFPSNCVSWYCFLPPMLAIPILRVKILKTSDSWLRLVLRIQILICFKMNNMDYNIEREFQAFTRFKNESLQFWSIFLHALDILFDLQTVSDYKWLAIQHIICALQMRNDLLKLSFLIPVLKKSVFCNIGKGSIEADISTITSIYLNDPRGPVQTIEDWNFFKNNSAHEKMCLEAFLGALEFRGQIFLAQSEETNISRLDELLLGLLKAVFEYNKRMDLDDSIIRLQDYTLLKGHIGPAIKLASMKDYNELRLYFMSAVPYYSFPIRNGYDDSNFESILTDVKKDIFSNCGLFINEIRKPIFRKKKYILKRFFQIIQWYNEVPLTFIQHAIDYLNEESYDSYFILSYLLGGSDYFHTVKQLLDLVLSRENLINSEEVFKSVLVCSPPVPLKLFEIFVNKTFLMNLLKVMYSIAQKSSPDKILDFARFMMNYGEISIKKQGLQLALTVTPNYNDFLKNQWKSATHHSIKHTLLLSSLRNFKQYPSRDSWALLETTLTTSSLDDKAVIQKLIPLDSIPSDYSFTYIKIVLGIICTLEDERKKDFIQSSKNEIFNQLDVSYTGILPNEFLLWIITTFVFKSKEDNPAEVVSNLHSVIFDLYLTNTNDVNNIDDFMTSLKKCFDNDFNRAWKVFEKLVQYLQSWVFENESACEEIFSYDTISYLVKSLKAIFETILSPLYAIRAIAVLTFMETYVEQKGSFECFKKMVDVNSSFDSLVSVFGSEFTFYFVSVLFEFLDKFDVEKFEIVKSLLESNTKAAHIVASMLVDKYFSSDDKNAIEFEGIRSVLNNSNYITVRTILKNNIFK